jgi:coproporphyrinogen III oxidase-like Fe-S oxidoreductase
MTGLRLTQEGVSMHEFQTRFGQSMHDVFGKEINELLKLGLLEKQTSKVSETLEVLRLTPHGRLLGNQVFMQFVD